MPHLTLEYTRDLADFAVADTLREINRSLFASGEIQAEADLKARAIALDTVQVGTEPGARAFVHAQLRLLSGRTPEAKQALSERIAVVLRQRVPRPAGALVQLSVEIVDMDRASYVKERLSEG
ncbi:MAG: 5-carboxymethyl-2-hydroxymuconate Delta-isomerase [Xylophilus ampelinus]